MTVRSTSSYCTFMVNDLLLGILVTDVQEIIRHQPATRVPLANPVVDGLINLRGQILTALDLRRRIGLEVPATRPEPMHVIVRGSGALVSLQVDGVGDVLDLDPGAFEPPPEPLRPPLRQMVNGVFKLDGRLLIVLDTDKVISI